MKESYEGVKVSVENDLSRSLQTCGNSDVICNCDGKLNTVIACLNNAKSALNSNCDLLEERREACDKAIWCALGGIKERGLQIRKKY